MIYLVVLKLRTDRTAGSSHNPKAIMKTFINAKSEPNPEPAGDARGTVPRPHPSKPFEHRHERRKIREQLRRLNWELTAEDEIYA